MLIPLAVAEGIRDGSVSVAFRRWEAPRVKVGSTQLTPAGVVEFVAVDEVADRDGGTTGPPQVDRQELPPRVPGCRVDE